MGKVVVDSSVVIALSDPTDALHSSATVAVQAHRAEDDELRIPASVLAEVLVGAARLGTEQLQQHSRRVLGAFGPVITLDAEIAIAAAMLRAQHRALRLPDALVLATAQRWMADVVLTADSRWAAIDARVSLLAP